MSARKRGLGRGLDALLSSGSPAGDAESGEELREIPVTVLQPGRHQPRRHFDEQALAELSRSIKAQGVVQPLIVRRLGGERYEIVAGERRWRAAKLAGLARVPAVVRDLDERASIAAALVENIQRADLNPIEEAEALRALIAECGLTHETAAEAVGRSRAAVTNLLRILELAPEVQQMMRSGGLSFGHAKVLLGAQGAAQIALARRVVEEKLSVRETERALRRAEAAPAVARAAPPPLPLETELTQRIGLPVKLRAAGKGRGSVTIRYRNAEELERLLGRLR